MKFLETPLKGAFVIDLEKREDERGFLPVRGARRSLNRMGYIDYRFRPICRTIKKEGP